MIYFHWEYMRILVLIDFPILSTFSSLRKLIVLREDKVGQIDFVLLALSGPRGRLMTGII